MATGIFKHPVKSLLAIGATTALIAAAPLVGIASATVASTLAIGFAGFSLFKAGKDVAETIKDNNEGRYDEVREDIQNLGGDGLDLALSLPFLPKALKQVSRTIKYGRSTIGLNTELISNINKGGLASIPRELAKANTKISYEMIGNEMGLAVKAEIEFYNSPLKISDKMTTAGEFDPVSGNVKINEYFINGKGKLIGNLTGQNVETTLILKRNEIRPDTAIVDIEALALSDDVFGNNEEDIPNIKELIEQIKEDEGMAGKTAEAIELMFKFKKIL